jgi:predicted HicB family RNase H-like nuclease
MEYKGYTARVEFDQEAGVLHGEVEGLRDVITFEATDVRQLEKEFRASVDDYLDHCLELNEEPEKPYSGKFLIRVDPLLHRDAAMAAARAGKSLNAFAADLLRSWIGSQTRFGDSTLVPKSNTVPDPERGMPLFANPSLGAVLADSQARLPPWQTFVRNTPESITPNTPDASNTPGSASSTTEKSSKRKAA